MPLLCMLVLFLVVFFVSTRENFAIHDKPASWTEELIVSRDPTKQELWNLSQSYLTDAWECRSRIQTIPAQRWIMTKDCSIQKSGCR